MRRLIEYILRWHCQRYHNEITRPQFQKYTCLKCQREYEFDWQPMEWVSE